MFDQLSRTCAFNPQHEVSGRVAERAVLHVVTTTEPYHHSSDYHPAGGPDGIKSERDGKPVDIFLKDYSRLGYNNLVPRNAFLLDLSLYVSTLQELVKSACRFSQDNPCYVRPEIKPSPPWSCRAKALLKSLTCFVFGTCPSLADFRQPMKIGLAIIIATVAVFDDSAVKMMGAANYWSVIAICFVASSHPGSSFKGGANRIQGTALGAMFGFITDWLNLNSPVAVVVSLTLWTFICCFNGASPDYGPIATVAAVTAAIILVGPYHVAIGQGALFRVQQTILGIVLYVAIDNLIFPARAKLQLRREVAACIDVFRNLWQETLDLFLQKTTEPVEDTEKTINKLRADLQVVKRAIGYMSRCLNQVCLFS